LIEKLVLKGEFSRISYKINVYICLLYLLYHLL